MDILNTIIIIIGLGIIIFLLTKKKEVKEDDKSMMLLQQQVNDLNKQLTEKIDKTTHHSAKMLQDQFMETSRISKDMIEKLLKLEETNKEVVGFTDQLQQLQNILKNPKQRGILGEYFLETVLKNTLPPGSYQMQYGFKNKEIVDAVVFVKDKVVPIDSKFSLDNYNRLAEEKDEAEREKKEKVFVNDLKTRIVETSKYIKPNEGTTDFAFMFIPHEAIYYDLLTNKVGNIKGEDNNILQRAASKHKVVIVSPTSFLAYLQTVLQGLKSLQIEESAKEIIKNVEKLQKHMISYQDHHTRLGNQISTVVSTYNTSAKEFKKIDKDIVKISGEDSNLEIEELEKPKIG